MIAIDFTVELIKDQKRLTSLVERLCSLSVFALDIETVNWWNQPQERVALIQIAYRSGGKTKVAVIDSFAEFDLEPLGQPLELPSATKVIHNAAFDANKLARHFNFQTAPVYDTMAAARRGGERRYSLRAQAEIHLKLHLDKSAQRSDWSRRPLDAKQIRYAALDAFATLLLYEHQTGRKLNGAFQLKNAIESAQSRLPLIDGSKTETARIIEDIKPSSIERTSATNQSGCLPKNEFSLPEIALLGIITELPTRYHPDQLTASVGSRERVGLAGWIIDRTLGADTDLDEETAKLAIADLCERNLVRITETRRLEATEEGAHRWRQLKSI